MNRREFLLATAAAAALPSLSFSGKLFAAPPSAPRFLFVFLRGGYDCNNLLVPYNSDFYYDSRPTLAIARPDQGNLDSAIALDSNWGLNPVLRDSIYPLWQRKQIAFVPFAGTDDLSRSHFETQDNIESGEPSQQRNGYGSGFLARLALAAPDSAPIAFTDALPLSFQGGKDIPNLSLRGVSKPAFDNRQSSILASMYKGTPLAASASDGLELRQHVSKDLEEEMMRANRGAATAKNFAAETQRIATLMRDQYRLGFVDVGGWDTHVNQGSTTGNLANNLANLGQGLAAYAQALGDEWNTTTVVVVSEFGRTFRENGDRGTDHGHGTVYWVLGGNVRGGRIVGEQVAVNQNTLLQNRDYPVLNNYRDLLGGLLGRTWGLSTSQLQAVFPGARPNALQLV
ncbi:DUF1501 domain-containing protein [Pseudomonas sp. CCI3.2]|uniref:DUF1501 domain-containing protein n=1 Tax=unclassified Pseudomonas TaxID=196821 RepID=UPI002AC9657C|nr:MULTISPECIES: DUF1501 domain-containing protein [unclassified Pseudomonas]MEB0079656.1 DUF1501 domain-containing protein [Pseudomonas sp. MH10out]MEB0093403.1 DUF1501 domain-containing protein [Pseudomonas sp. CCI4.2]MEB0102280.1 DUF1501 domain-containing protein [Pseudomonas sp. CCI3.2]MEB0129412.1 DUF1501 domain-containing protein [Pseudomonas sp. CCI2.4]MEB0160577.1 DUF1501 domain-containing protein [Pseudomonas sp. AH2 (2023)]